MLSRHWIGHQFLLSLRPPWPLVWVVLSCLSVLSRRLMSGCQPLLVMSRGCSCAPLVVVAGVIRPLLCCIGSPGLTESVLPHVLSGTVCVGCRLLPLLCLGLGLHIGLCVGSGGPCGFMILHTYAVRSPASSGSFCAYLPSALLPALLPFCSTFLPCLA